LVLQSGASVDLLAGRRRGGSTGVAGVCRARAAARPANALALPPRPATLVAAGVALESDHRPGAMARTRNSPRRPGAARTAAAARRPRVRRRSRVARGALRAGSGRDAGGLAACHGLGSWLEPVAGVGHDRLALASLVAALRAGRQA